MLITSPSPMLGNFTIHFISSRILDILIAKAFGITIWKSDGAEWLVLYIFPFIGQNNYNRLSVRQCLDSNATAVLPGIRYESIHPWWLGGRVLWLSYVNIVRYPSNAQSKILPFSVLSPRSFHVFLVKKIARLQQDSRQTSTKRQRMVKPNWQHIKRMH